MSETQSVTEKSSQAVTQSPSLHDPQDHQYKMRLKSLEDKIEKQQKVLDSHTEKFSALRQSLSTPWLVPRIPD